MSERLNIVVAGTIASVPGHAGWTWAVLQYVLGFRKLGHRVWFVDPVAAASLRPAGATLEESDNRRYFGSVIRQFGIDERATLLLDDGAATAGCSIGALRTALRDADLLINVSGALRDDALLSRARRSVYLDVDPAFTQLWAAVEGIDVGFGGHSHYVTIGWNIGAPSSPVPSAGRRWIPTLQPVVLDYWTAQHGAAGHGFTTVGNWRGYGSVEYRGTLFGQKAHSLRQLLRVPRRTGEPFVLALAIDPGEVKDLAALAEHGWQLVDPTAVSASPAAYQTFIQRSKAEFAVAKSGYVAARCGWFSDRSICYLASGRPVLAHDTGLDGILPLGEGVIAFSTEDDVVAGVEAINADYQRHARAARAIAEEYFDSDRVLTRLLAEVGR